MEFYKELELKDGKKLLLRSGVEADGESVMENFNTTHGETDFLLSYPDENSMDAKEESEFLKKKMESPNEVELLAFVDGKLAGTAGIDALGSKYKISHRAEFGMGILKEFWGMGIGRIMMESCIECAREAGYSQLELDVVADNSRAVLLYEKLGFKEFGRNPRGFHSRNGSYQELIYMRLEL